MKKSRAKTTKNRMEMFHLQVVINPTQFNLLHILVSHRRTCTSQKLQLSAQNNQTKPPQPNKTQLLNRFPEGNSGREVEVNQPKERSTRNDSRQNLKGKQYLCPSVELHVFLCSPNWVADLAGKFSPNLTNNATRILSPPGPLIVICMFRFVELLSWVSLSFFVFKKSFCQ